MHKLEKDIERRLKKKVESRGGLCLKFTPAESGFPDRVLVLPGGRVVFVELKRAATERPRKLQEYQIKRLKDLGAEVYVVAGDDQLEAFLHGL